MVLDLQIDDDDNQKFTDDERDKLVSYLSKSIQNVSRSIEIKKSQCRYSSHMINVSMSLYLKNKEHMKN